MPRWLLLPAGLLLLDIFQSTLPHHPMAASQPSLQSSADGNADKKVNVIVVGATGDLAAKYLWVSMFRLALESRMIFRRTIRFFAGAVDSLEQGKVWLERFFDDKFADRVCGVRQEPMSFAQTKCRRFMDTEFKQSVQYAPLWTEKHYQELGRSLMKVNDDTTEEGRIVYLAIPPQFFLQSCELIHRYLRPQQLEVASYLRVVVEKPFGRDFQSARELATRLRTIYSNNELFVVDHYAGKPVVRALREYFQLNAAAFYPIWNSEFIKDIYIEMLETATLENRTQYFDSAGIIRDVMVNHLQLLLVVAVSPSFGIHTAPITTNKATQTLREAQLRFIKALEPSSQQNALFFAQYDKYAAHYEAEMKTHFNNSDHFTPTAASIELRSSLDEWRNYCLGNNTFRLLAAKAAAERLLSITFTFKAETFSNKQVDQCTLTVTIQRSHNIVSSQSQRIEWSCDVSKVFPDLQVPSGWKFFGVNNHRIIIPEQVNDILMNNVAAWELGDEVSAYDFLLRKVASGAVEHFADLDEVEAAWALWTPVANAAEAMKHGSMNEGANSRLKFALYPIGTTPWKNSEVKSRLAKEEL